MEWALQCGDRVRYRSHGREGEDRLRLGTVRKSIHILTAQLEKVPVYIVDSDEEDPVILGDGEILEKLPLETTDPSPRPVREAPTSHVPLASAEAREERSNRPTPFPREGRGSLAPLPATPRYGEGLGVRTPGPEVGSVLLLDTDLFFVVKVTDTLKHAGYATATARTEADFAHALAERPPIVALVNTAARGVDFRRAIQLARDAVVPVIAFGSHADLQTQEEARQAGATRVIANSRLASDLPGVLERTLRQFSSGSPRVTDADLDEDES